MSDSKKKRFKKESKEKHEQFLFYRYEREQSGVQLEVSIGPISASVGEIIISIQASLVTFPINFLVVFLLKKTASWQQWKDRRTNGKKG